MANEDEPLFYQVKKSTGRITYNAQYEQFQFYRRVVKETGWALFSCSNKQCKAGISVKYESKEESNIDVPPMILR